MTTYITIPLDDLDAFRRTYFVTTSEEIQSEVILNDIETHCIVGSSRITNNQIAVLQEKYPEVQFSQQIPSFFNFKEYTTDV